MALKLGNYTRNLRLHTPGSGRFRLFLRWNRLVWRWLGGLVWLECLFSVQDCAVCWARPISSFRIFWWLLSSLCVYWDPSWRLRMLLCPVLHRLGSFSTRPRPSSLDQPSKTFVVAWDSFSIAGLATISCLWATSVLWVPSVPFAPSSWFWVCSCSWEESFAAWECWWALCSGFWPFPTLFIAITRFFWGWSASAFSTDCGFLILSPCSSDCLNSFYQPPDLGYSAPISYLKLCWECFALK